MGHLFLAGMSDYKTTGVGSNNTTETTPTGPYDSSTYVLENHNPFSLRSDNYLNFTRYDPVGDNSWEGIMTVASTQMVDKKLDDGVANSGNLYGFTGNNETNDDDCSAKKATANGADYNLDSTAKKPCALAYVLDIPL